MKESREENRKRKIIETKLQKHKNNRKIIEGNRKERKKERNTEQEVSLDSYQKEGEERQQAKTIEIKEKYQIEVSKKIKTDRKKTD